MFSRFFIERPVFSWVLAIVIMLAGLLSINTLPVSQFPQIAPPQVAISASYPGASADTISNTVTQDSALGALGTVLAGEATEETIRAGFGDILDGPKLPPHLQAQVGKKIL